MFCTKGGCGLGSSHSQETLVIRIIHGVLLGCCKTGPTPYAVMQDWPWLAASWSAALFPIACWLHDVNMHCTLYIVYKQHSERDIAT